MGAGEELAYHAIIQDAGAVIANYLPGCFVCPEHSPDSFSVAIIACVNSRSLVAFSSDSWAKKTSDRKLPPTALEKAICVKVPACTGEERDEPAAGLSVTIWIGWLKQSLENCITFDTGADPSLDFLTRESGERCLPYAQAMVDAVFDRFGLKELLDPQPMEARLTAMEGRFSSLEQGVQELLAMQRGGGFVSAQEYVEDAPPPAASRAAARPSARPQQAEVAAPPGLGGGYGFAGLDPGAVNAAMRAGIPAEQLQKMADLLGKKPSKLEDYPRQNPAAEIFGDTEDDAADVGEAQDALQDAPQDAVGKALVKLTTIVGQLAKQKDESADLRDGVGGGASGLGESSSSMGKRHALVRQNLQKTFRNDPERIWRVIERNMEEEYNMSNSRPGLGSSTFSARGWAEHRSKILGYPRTVRSVWGVAGILDALRSNDIHQARTRACLMLAQYEQESLDHGSYMLAGEFSLESPPPISSFSQHTLPDAMEMASTKLLNQQWVEAFTDRLKQVDSYVEIRRKLGARGKGASSNPAADGKPGKGKGDGKGKSKSKKGDKQERQEEQGEQ